ncbi:uncharacterized protein [Panulirus ornatus]|uniref:uncharacterized protein n=1 Tax=Panulirus ornatus TaxID=150431 RepID=UPI003A85E296
MRSSSVVLALLVISWVAAVEATLLLAGALALGGLAALKGAFLFSASRRRGYGRYHGRGYRFRIRKRYGRAVHSAPVDGENLLLSAVGELDPNGCILKMLCHLQTMEEGTRTLEEDILVDMFARGNETLTSYNAPFIYATDIGSRTRDTTTCDKNFSKCPLSNAQLSGLLHQAWGCGFDLIDDNDQNQENLTHADQEDQTSTSGQSERVHLVD